VYLHPAAFISGLLERAALLFIREDKTREARHFNFRIKHKM
jgi:hypothetical protein